MELSTYSLILKVFHLDSRTQDVHTQYVVRIKKDRLDARDGFKDMEVLPSY